MRIAIMQPYFMPYIGYFQLMKSADKFVVYDRIKFTKKGWINRNRILNQTNEAELFSIPLKSDSDFKNVIDRHLSDVADKDIRKTLAKISQIYKKTKFFDEIYPIIEKCFNYKSANLFDYIFNSITEISTFLEIKTKVIISSSIENDANELKNTDRVINICKILHATEYINPIGGVELYNKEDFKNHNISLIFHKINEIQYPQNTKEFIANLSIIDVLFFNGKEQSINLLNEFGIIE